MARQNSRLPKGALPHLRPPHATHDEAEMAQGYDDKGYDSAYPLPFDTHEPDGRAPRSNAPPHDIFSTLRPDPPDLDVPFEPFAPPGGRPPAQGGYAHPQFGLPEGDPAYDDAPYASPYDGHAQAHTHAHTHDPYGRPLPGGYPAQQEAYEEDAAPGHALGHAPEHDPHYYAPPPPHQQHAYAPQEAYRPHEAPHDDAYAYDDTYRPEAAGVYDDAPPMPHSQGTDPGYYDDEAYPEEAEEPVRRGPRAIVVVGALLGAIALGGGLAYGYKAMTSSGRDGKLPILRAESAPAKAQPSDPGGKQMAHTDKKILNRLAEDRGPPGPVPVSIQPPAPERDTGDGPRRVPTMIINRDGTIASGGPPQREMPGPPPSGVPGLLVDGLTPRMPPPQRELAPPPRAMPIEEPAPAVAPRRVASAPVAAAMEPPPAAMPAPAPRAEASPRRPVPTRQAARTPPAAASSAPPSLGYVAVLASRQSHMDALKSLADIQQKHPAVLQGRAADVRQANLGSKGMWYRVVVGPPGSRERANTVCGQLRSQGYSGCWVMSY